MRFIPTFLGLYTEVFRGKNEKLFFLSFYSIFATNKTIKLCY